MKKCFCRAFLATLLVVVALVGISPDAITAAAAATTIEKEQYMVETGKVFVPRVIGLQDAETQQKINATLKAAIFNLVAETPGSSLNGDFEVSFDNGRVLGIHFIGYTMAPGAVHPNKLDLGIHVDLASGTLYKLADLFVPGIDYNAKIKVICEQNQTAYRLHIPKLFENWPHSDFAQSWSDSDAAFLLQASSVRVYSIPRYATGAISGYRIPYADLMGIIDSKGTLWKRLQ